MGDAVTEAREETRVTTQSTTTCDTGLPTGVTRAPASALGEDVLLWRATRDLLWPWSKRAYPGLLKTAAIALGFVPSTVKRWAFAGGPGVSVEAAQRIERHLRQHAGRAAALADAWNAYAADRAATWTPPPYFRAARLAESDGWRSAQKKSRKRSSGG